MTYMAGGKQYVAFPIGGANITEELIRTQAALNVAAPNYRGSGGGSRPVPGPGNMAYLTRTPAASRSPRNSGRGQDRQAAVTCAIIGPP